MASPKCRIACALIQQASASGILRSFAEACFRFTPQIAFREGEAVFLEIGRSHHLFSEDGFQRRIQALARWFELKIQIGIGDTAGEALAIARHGRPLPLQALQQFASPFAPNEEIELHVRELISKLRMLGFKNFDEFRRFPASGLASRFGEVAALLSAKVHGELESAWPEFQPTASITESSDIEEDVSVPSLIFILRGLSDRALARLWAKAERASVIEVRFDLAKWSTLNSFERRWRIELPLPQGTSTGLIPIIQEHLMADLTKVAFGAPVTKVSFTILESVPGNGAQRDFFHKKEQEREAWNALVGRLAYKLGNDRVFVALPVERYLPEKAWTRQLEFVSSGDDAFPPRWPERPARLLRVPEIVRWAGGCLLHPSSGKKWKILKWEGPERLSGEWWRDPKFEGFFRDYYRIIAETGEQLWIFLNRKSAEQEVYLHGYFD